MDNKYLNYNIAQTEAALDIWLSNLPVGVAYLLLKNKIQEIQPLFQQQVILEQQNQKNQKNNQSQIKLDQQDNQNKQKGQE